MIQQELVIRHPNNSEYFSSDETINHEFIRKECPEKAGNCIQKCMMKVDY